MSYFQYLTACAVLTGLVSGVQAAPQSLSRQVADMPSDFREHFFNAPVAARVILDGKVLGDAMIMLTENEHVRLVRFTDTGDSSLPESERQRWQTLLSSPVPLGTCVTACPDGLMAADFNLTDARLTLITPSGGEAGQSRWFDFPETNNTGLMLSNHLNLSGGQQQDSVLSWNGGLEGALGNWSAVSKFQLDRSDNGEPARHAVTSLYAQREFRQHFMRAGMFTPDSQGLLHQPWLRGGGVSTLVGVMAGSGDALLKDTDAASLYPVYVTANREGVAQVYRDGALIYTQPVEPGMQTLDTRELPGGIYEVEIRILEDGRETSRLTETINKPTHWRDNGQRLRYNVFAGQQKTLWNSDPGADTGQAAAGASLNYLIHPRATVGAAVQKTGQEKQVAGSVNWQVASPFQLYGSLWHSSETGYGSDLQAVWTHERGNVSFNHNRSWYRAPDSSRNSSGSSTSTHNSALSASLRINSDHTVNGRITHNSSSGQAGMDVGYNTRTQVWETPVSWRLAAFDRPYRDSTSLRNRGVSLNASFPLGGEKRSGSLSLGNRTDSSGARDMYASASLTQQWGETSPVKESSGTLTADRHGVGLSAFNRVETSLVDGSFWGQKSSRDNQLSGGLSLGSMVALGKGKAVLTQQVAHHQGGGMIVDVISDEPDTQLMALHPAGSTQLKPGRNFIPVEAWKPGTIQLDFPGKEAPALKIEPEYIDYHHTRGGVSSHEVRVMKTVTVMGRMVDARGEPLGGAQVVNHAGRTVTESDGLFTLELHENNPVVAVEHSSGAQCEIRLNPAAQKRDDIIFAGNLTCDSLPLAENRRGQAEKAG
ncbi:CS1-pili formation C-terminal domain-containing protein [Cronobacter sakazakii]